MEWAPAEAPVTPMMLRAQRMLAAHGHFTHVDRVGRLWASYEWSTRETSGTTFEVITNITRSALRDWLGY